MPRRIGKDGIVFREGDTVVVQIKGKSWLLSEDGVTCINPKSSEEERIYQKVFSKTMIYLPNQYDKAVAENIHNANGTFVLGANGYSSLNDEQLRRYGIHDQEYEEACIALLRRAYLNLQERFPGVQIRFVDGASDMGIDRALHEVEKEFNIPSLGFSCPEFLFYVNDELHKSVYVAKNKTEYADLFCCTLDLLVCTGGRGHAYVMDQSAVNKHQKYLHYVDVLNTITRVGYVPAIVIQEDGTAVVDNAAALFGDRITYFGQGDLKYETPDGGDRWMAAETNICAITTHVCRRTITQPEIRFKSYAKKVVA